MPWGFVPKCALRVALFLSHNGMFAYHTVLLFLSVPHSVTPAQFPFPRVVIPVLILLAPPLRLVMFWFAAELRAVFALPGFRGVSGAILRVGPRSFSTVGVRCMRSKGREERRSPRSLYVYNCIVM